MLIELDGTPNKGSLGANAILGVSLAVASAAADAAGLPLYRYLGGASAHTLPVPMMNILNGGSARRHTRRLPGVHGHAGRRADASPRRCAWAPRSIHALKRRAARSAARRPRSATRAASRRACASNEEALELILEAIERPATSPATESRIALDPAATEFYEDGKYTLQGRGQTLTRRGDGRLTGRDWAAQYPIVSIEDGLAEDDWDGWRR